MKILYVTTVGSTMNFFQKLIEEVISNGDTVDVITSDNGRTPAYLYKLGCSVRFVSFSRTPLNCGNIKAVNQVKSLVAEGEYDVVHCHTPIAAFCTRLACRKLRKKGLKVVYTAHGFHFFKGAPLKNWLIYYPLEKLCARWTDVLITINKEDFDLASKKMRAVRTEYVPGVGIDFKKFADVSADRNAKRRELDIPTDAYLMCSVGELNRNKNHEVVIRALAALNNPNVYYIVAGCGGLRDYLNDLAQKLGVANQVKLLGYRNDVAELYKASDVCVFSSIREGLGLAPIEGMACGLPLICSDNRGTREYAVDGKNAIVCDWNDVDAFRNAIESLKDRAKLVNFDGKKNIEELKGKFDYGNINRIMEEIYRSLADLRI